MTANSISVGNVLKHKDRFWVVSKTEHVKPGKGGAFVQVEMKDIITGTKLNERFRASEDVQKAFLEDISYQYQYDEGDSIALMNNETFEQISLDKSIVGNKMPFLEEGMEVKVLFCEETPISIKISESVVLEVTETDPHMKGQTVTSSYKPAMLSNGVKTSVPPFIENGDRVVVKTEDASYVERAK